MRTSKGRQATQRIWRYISEQAALRRPFTYRSIAKACGPPYSMNSIDYHLVHLEDDGLIAKRKGMLEGASIEVLVPLLPLIIRREASNA